MVPESLESQLPDDVDLGDFEGVEWITKPDRVECAHCGTKFGVAKE